MDTSPLAFFWFRRDLRLEDNAGLYYALRSGLPVLPVFIFDRNILDGLDDKTDRRVQFIHDEVCRLQRELRGLGSDLLVIHDVALTAWHKLLGDYRIIKVFTNHDYEPYALKRDAAVGDLLRQAGVEFFTFKDQVVFEKDEVLKDDGNPYTVFTPYSRKWKAKLNAFYQRSYPVAKYFHAFWRFEAPPVVDLRQMGFAPAAIHYPARHVSNDLLSSYDQTRNLPAIDGTSRLSVHLRFGTISIRTLLAQAIGANEQFVNELIWRDFYQMILWHFPHTTSASFRSEFDRIEWLNNEEHFERWCNGNTGYPLVDAGMRQLNQTGWMHNRVRMVTASFLTKHLLIDWRWGERYFAEKLIDFDLAANVGGWQWAAGCGTDAAPYFRIFNPVAQQQRFDPAFGYIRQWVPEYGTAAYPPPIVDHGFARKRALSHYARFLRELR